MRYTVAESAKPASDDPKPADPLAPLREKTAAELAAIPAVPPIIDGHRMPSGLTPRQEARMIARSVRGRWAVDDETRRASLLTIRQIMLDPNATNRDRIGAVDAVMAMDAADREEDKLDATLDGPQTPQGVMVGVNVNVPAAGQPAGEEGKEDDAANADKVAGTVAAILARLHGPGNTSQ